MNLRDLSYVISVADLGHFGRAAIACNVSQSTLSGQILKVEKELGVAIFERVGMQVHVTRVGAQILLNARRSVAAANDIVTAALVSRDPLAGTIRLGIIPTLAPYLIPFVLPSAAIDLPNAPLILLEDLTDNLLLPLADGRIDAALIATDPSTDRLAEIDLFEESFWLAIPIGDLLAEEAEIDLKFIDPGQLLLLTDGHCLRDQAISLCAHRGSEKSLAGSADVRTASLETLVRLTAAKYGLTLAPRLAIANWVELQNQIAFRPIKGDKACRKVRLAFRRDTPRRKAMEALAEVIRSSLPDSVRRLR
jgi:LysR family hydrogen peroxide-inducible transcriptional activator